MQANPRAPESLDPAAELTEGSPPARCTQAASLDTSVFEFDAAMQFRDGAQFLVEHDAKSSSAVALKRLEVLLLIRLILRRNSIECVNPFLTEDDWARCVTIEAVNELVSAITPNQFSLLKAALGPGGELFLVGLDSRQRHSLGGALMRAELPLLDSVLTFADPKPSAKFWRTVRIVSVSAIALALLVAVGWFVNKKLAKPNLAFHRPVKTSSTSGPPHLAGQRLVDGDKSSLGFHTFGETNPYAVIDLGKSTAIEKVVVYNRTECCQERAIPLLLELSDDGSKFWTIAERREPFEVWVAESLHARGRYVRLYLNATNMFHLAEVEVY